MKSLYLLQAQYWESPFSFESAKLIVQRKCQNMAMLLNRYLIYRNKRYPDQAKILHSNISVILSVASRTDKVINRQQLFLFEGRASRAYWKGFALIARCPLYWKRVYPGASDPWNEALNIGYTFLRNFLHQQFDGKQLSFEIGLLHSPQAYHEALLYDFQELFRQPFVDAAIIPLFSRKKPDWIDSGIIISRILKMFNKKIILKEISSYISAVKARKLYIPYQHSWSHRVKKTYPVKITR